MHTMCLWLGVALNDWIIGAFKHSDFSPGGKPPSWGLVAHLTTATTYIFLQVSSAVAQRWKEDNLIWPVAVPPTACSRSDILMRITAGCWTSVNTISWITHRWLCRPCKQQCKEGKTCANHTSDCLCLLGGVFHALAHRKNVAFWTTAILRYRKKLPQVA